ncbi:MAG TPA: tetratricopeptide repeat protein [Pyrinomonadaceae bacterium]
MDNPPVQKIYEFEDFRFDAEHLMLYRRGEPIPLAPKAAETLLIFIERRGQILSKEELIEQIWPGAFVEESNLYLYLSVLRKTLGNQKSGTPYLETLRRRGYRFDGSVQLISDGSREEPHSAPVQVIEPIDSFRSATTDSLSVNDLPTDSSVWRQTNPAVNDLPESRRDWPLRRSSFAAIGVIALVAALALSYTYFFSRRSINSIAVMPFANESGNAELEYLSDGMTETLIASLSKLPDLQVKASSSVFRYKGSTDTQTIGKELNARAVLYGRVVQRGEDLVLHVELVDAQTENSLWGQTYNKKLSNLIALQGEVARDLVRELSLKPSGADKQKLAKNYTENVEAYQLFLNGRFHHRKLTPPEIKKGIAYLQQAIDTDPSYALAYTEISRAYTALALAGDMNPGEVLLKAKAAAQRAVEIDDALAEAHSSLGSVFFWYDWNWKEAEEHFIRALELDPNSSIAHFGYADFLSKMERPEEALAEIKRAREIEPFSPFINTFEAWFLAAGQPDAAMERVGIAIDLDPNFFFAHWIAAEIYKGKKMYPESIAESRLAKSLSPHQTWSDVGLAYTFVKTGQLNESRAILNEMLRLSESRWVPPYHIALVYNALGETDQALAWLEKGYQHRDPKMALLKEERWKNLRGDPRFQDLLRRVGF